MRKNGPYYKLSTYNHTNEIVEKKTEKLKDGGDLNSFQVPRSIHLCSNKNIKQKNRENLNIRNHAELILVIQYMYICT